MKCLTYIIGLSDTITWTTLTQRVDEVTPFMYINRTSFENILKWMTFK